MKRVNSVSAALCTDKTANNFSCPIKQLVEITWNESKALYYTPGLYHEHKNPGFYLENKDSLECDYSTLTWSVVLADLYASCAQEDLYDRWAMRPRRLVSTLFQLLILCRLAVQWAKATSHLAVF